MNEHAQKVYAMQALATQTIARRAPEKKETAIVATAQPWVYQIALVAPGAATVGEVSSALARAKTGSTSI